MNQPQSDKQALAGVPRIAASSYLNSVPLIWSFVTGTRRSQVELITDAAPAVCADMLSQGEVDAALVPVIEYQRISDLILVPQVCIASRSKVRSVVLVVREEVADLKRVQRVALDSSSRTSQALVQVLFREFFGSEPQWTTTPPNVESMLESNDAALLIGDPAISFSRRNVVVYDLAQLWRKHTGLGFVFAMWMTRPQDTARIRNVDFAAARDEGLAHVDDIADHYEGLVALDRAEIKLYLNDNIVYELDDDLREGLNLFYRLAHKHRIIPQVRDLKFMPR